MAKHATPLLDQLETGPWPSFVSDIKQLAESRAKNAQGLDYQIPSDAAEDLLGIMELSYEEKDREPCAQAADYSPQGGLLRAVG